MFKRFLSYSHGQRDIIKSLYLSELKAYKPQKVSAKADLPETFNIPKAPTAPILEKSVLSAEKGALETESWPALVDPIDDPENYNDEWNITQSTDDGSWFPKRVKPHEYHD